MSEQQNAMPQDPVTSAEAFSIQTHEKLIALITAGFSRKEAFTLVRDQHEAYWHTSYLHMFETHGCSKGCPGERE